MAKLLAKAEAARAAERLAISKRESGRELVRSCRDQLRQIESRLDVGVDGRWLEQLESVEDVVGLAQQMVPLQRLTTLDGNPESAWIEGMVAQPVPDEQVDELARRVVRQLDQLDRVVPPARNPADMLGESILKYFDGHGIFMGTIVEYDEHTGFRLQYDDGDTEDVSLRDLREMMPGRQAGRQRGEPLSASAPATSRKKQMLSHPTDAAASHADRPAGGKSGGKAAPSARERSAKSNGGSSSRGGGSKPVSRQASEGGGGTATVNSRAAAAETSAGTKRPLDTPPVAPVNVKEGEAHGKADSGSSTAAPIKESKEAMAAAAMANAEAELAQLPSGWTVEAKGKGALIQLPTTQTQTAGPRHYPPAPSSRPAASRCLDRRPPAWMSALPAPTSRSLAPARFTQPGLTSA